MKPIQMVDLVGQYQKIKAEVDAAVIDVMGSAAFIGGEHVKGLENELSEYVGVQHTIACANGTDALQIAMMALGLGRGDEVITPSFTFVATVEVVALLGIRPVFVDVLPGTFNMDPVDVERKITKHTKAIVPVHLFGQVADMDAINALAAKHDLFVIEDNAQAIGAAYTTTNGKRSMSGTLGHVSCTSFFPSKNLGCYGDGGAIFTNDDALAKKIRRICNHGSDVRYYHEVVGVNSRLDAIQAAILRIKLKQLDAYCAARNTAAMAYDEGFHGMEHVSVPQRDPKSTHVFHQYTLKVTGGHRDGLKEHLERCGVPAMIYYPVPCHLQNAYKAEQAIANDLPVTVALTKEVLSLPMSTELDNEQLDHIITSVKSYFQNK